MAENPFGSEVTSGDPIFKSALMKARYGGTFDEPGVLAVTKPLGEEMFQGGFELADALAFGKTLSQADPTAIASRFASQIKAPLLGDLDLSKQQATVDISDLVSGVGFMTPKLSLQNLLSARTGFSQDIQRRIQEQSGGSRLAALGPEATAQAFIESIKADPSAGDPTATFADMEGAPTLAYSTLQERAASDPFAEDVLRRIRDFTNVYDPNKPDQPLGQEQQIFNEQIAASEAADAAGTGGYDDTAVREQLASQNVILDTLRSELASMREGRPGSATAENVQDIISAAQAGRVSTTDIQEIINASKSGRLSAQDVQNIVSAQGEGRLTQEDISSIINQQLMQADIRGQVGAAVKTEFGDVITQQMVNRNEQEREQFNSLLGMLGERQQQDERMAREQWARQDQIRGQQEQAVSETIRTSERAGREAYDNVRGLPLVRTDFSATDPLRQKLQTAIMERIDGESVDAIRTERLAKLDEEADDARKGLTEKLNRLGVLRQGGNVTDTFGKFEGQVIRGRQGIESDMQILEQDLIGKGIAAGTDFRGQETNTELQRTLQLSDQLRNARDLDVRRNLLQQEVSDRTLARGLTRLGPTEREVFENQMRGQAQSEYLARSEFSQRAEQAALDREFTAGESLAQRDFTEAQTELQRKSAEQQASKERGLRRYEIGQNTIESSANRQLQRDLSEQQTDIEQQRLDLDSEAESSRSLLARDEFERSMIQDSTQRSQFDRQLAQSKKEADTQREFLGEESQRQRIFDFQELVATQEAADSRSILDRQLQRDLQEGANEFATTLEGIRNTHDASESVLTRDLQRDILQSDREQALAERNLKESEANLNRLQQKSERIGQQNFQRGMVSQDHAQRQSDRNLQRELVQAEVTATANLASTQREHERAQSREQGVLDRERDNLNRKAASDEALLQRGFLRQQNFEDRRLQGDLQNLQNLSNAAEAETHREFQAEQGELDWTRTREQNRFVGQQAQLDRDSVENESKLQRGLIADQAYADRQHQIFLSQEQIKADRASARETNNFAREQNRFSAQQNELDRELQEAESANQRGFLSNESFQDRQNQLWLQREQLEASRDAARVGYDFEREQNRFSAQQSELDRDVATQQAELDRELQANETALQRGFIRDQEYADRQNQLYMQKADISANKEAQSADIEAARVEADLGRDFQRDQNTWQEQQYELDRQASENESNRQRGFISDQAYADRQQEIYVQNLQLDEARNESKLNRRFTADQAYADKQHQIGLQRGVLDDAESARNFQKAEADRGRNFAREQNTFTAQQAELDRDAVELENALQRGFITDQNYQDRQNQIALQRASLRQQQQQFTSGQEFAREENRFTAQQAKLTRDLQSEQFNKNYEFTTQQADADNRLRAIGAMLAAQDAGIDTGYGMGGARPGGVAGALGTEFERMMGFTYSTTNELTPTGEPALSDSDFRGFLYGAELGTGEARVSNLQQIVESATLTESGLVHPDFTIGQMAAIEQEIRSNRQALDDRAESESGSWWNPFDWGR